MYMLWKGRVGMLKQNLYGVGDAHKIFNEGLVEHLQKGNYNQSIYNQLEMVMGKQYGAEEI